MKFITLNSLDCRRLKPFVEVEVSLIPGLPKLSIIGLPDAGLKEGVLRIKSAIFNQGFDWPRNKEIIVNLKPAHLKKCPQNIEFAIVVALLQKTGQIDLKTYFGAQNSILILGDLDLSGRVKLDASLTNRFFARWSSNILAGQSQSSSLFSHYCVKSISDLKKTNLFFKKAIDFTKQIQRPNFDTSLMWTSKEARLLKLLAFSKVSALIAGPQGSGKTCLAKEVWKLMSFPKSQDYESFCQQAGRLVHWRPLVVPHHSIPRLSLLGGGVPVREGEVARANGGLMVLDELLEFKKESLEVLREVMQGDPVEISRRGEVLKIKTDFQAIATTNLCPCGKWMGPSDYSSCSRSLSRCKAYLSRLSGPIADRFEVLWLKPYRETQKKQNRLSTHEVFEDLQKARAFKAQRIKKISNISNASSKLAINLESTHLRLQKAWYKDVYTFDGVSERRKKAFWRVADALADLDGSFYIQKEHLHESYTLTCMDFGSLS